MSNKYSSILEKQQHITDAYRDTLHSVYEKWADFLSANEQLTLLWLINRTTRYGKRGERIPTRHFEHGICSRDGTCTSGPLRIARRTYTLAIRSLEDLGIVVRYGVDQARKGPNRPAIIYEIKFKVVIKGHPDMGKLKLSRAKMMEEFYSAGEENEEEIPVKTEKKSVQTGSLNTHLSTRKTLEIKTIETKTFVPAKTTGTTEGLLEENTPLTSKLKIPKQTRSRTKKNEEQYEEEIDQPALPIQVLEGTPCSAPAAPPVDTIKASIQRTVDAVNASRAEKQAKALADVNEARTLTVSALNTLWQKSLQEHYPGVPAVGATNTDIAILKRNMKAYPLNGPIAPFLDWCVHSWADNRQNSLRWYREKGVGDRLPDTPTLPTVARMYRYLLQLYASWEFAKRDRTNLQTREIAEYRHRAKQAEQNEAMATAKAKKQAYGSWMAMLQANARAKDLEVALQKEKRKAQNAAIVAKLPAFPTDPAEQDAYYANLPDLEPWLDEDDDDEEEGK